MEQKLSIRDCLRFGWETFKKQPLLFIAAALLVTAVWVVSDILYYTNYADTQIGWGIEFVVSMLAVVLNAIIVTNFMCKAHDNPEAVSYADILTSVNFWKLMGTLLLGSLLVVIGIILLIIPGLIVMSMIALATYAAVEKNMRPVAALKYSREITKGNRWKIFGLVLCTLASTIVYLVALIFVSDFPATLLSRVADLVVLPVSALALVHAYRQLDKEPAVVAEV